MGSTVREKHVRANRRTRPVKSDSNHSTTSETSDNVEKSADSNFEMKPRNNHMALDALAENQIALPNNLNSVFDDSGWGYCTEEQLEELLLKNLEFLYNEAINKLMGLGYEEDVALKAVLRNGHYYGGMDVLTNIVHSSLDYLNKGGSNCEEPECEASFMDLRQLEEYTLARMVCLLQKFKPHLSKGDAMWCLLMSDLHVGRAREMEIPALPSLSVSGSSNGNECTSESAGGSGSSEIDVSSGAPVEVAPALSKFHGGWGFGNNGTSEFPMNGFFSYASEMALQREIECPKRFNLSPSMKSLLKRNVAMFAAGFRANAKLFNSQSRLPGASLFGGDTSNAKGATADVPEVISQYTKNQDVVNSVLSKFQDLNLDENTTEKASLDQKDDMILGLVHQIKDLEKQVKERKEWAQEKAMQAARKLSSDLAELKMLRMERDETQRLKKGKETHEETTMKRLKEMESALRKASAQVDRANNAVRKLENENAEIRAEMEASKLSASESVNTCLEIAKREKKYLKRLLAWEKQKTKMQEDIAEEKRKMSELHQEFAQVEAATKEAEAKWKEEQKAKELVLTQVEEERRLKEASEANSKRKLEALRLKIEMDFQRHRDDLQRLEQEYTRLKKQSTETEHQSNDIWTDNSNDVNPQGEIIARLLRELERLEEDSQEKEVSHDRECMICMTDEVSVVFLPCAHQVICANCNESYGKKGKALCPCCRVPIEQRIRVFGACS